jgi:hypothetical protein
MATQTGFKVVFGYTGTDGIAATGLTGNILFTDHTYKKSREKKKLANAAGDTVTKIRYDEMQEATLEIIFASATDVATAISNKATIIALDGTILNITACASAPELINSHWLVEDVDVKGSNADAHKVSLKLENHSNITASYA